MEWCCLGGWILMTRGTEGGEDVNPDGDVVVVVDDLRR